MVGKSLAVAVASAVVLTAQAGPHEARAREIFKQQLMSVTYSSVLPATSGEAPKAEHTLVFMQNVFDELRRRVPVDR